MYTIQVDAGRKRLAVVLSEHVDTDEALRALSQALTLSEADGISAVTCDVTAVRRGPGSLIHIAAGLALGYREGMRIALISGSDQHTTATRLMRYSGLRDGVRVFASQAAADAWLGPAALPAAVPAVPAAVPGVLTSRAAIAAARPGRRVKRGSGVDAAGSAA